MEFNATFLVSIISFVLFTLIMNKIFYKPIEKIVNERQNFLDETFSSAKKSSEEADKIFRDRDEKLQASLVNSKNIIAKSTLDANNEASQLTMQAKQNSKDKIVSMKNEIQKESEQLDKSLAPQIESLANDIVSKIMGVEV